MSEDKKTPEEAIEELYAEIKSLKARIASNALVCPKCNSSEQTEFFKGQGYLCHTCEIHIKVSEDKNEREI